MNEYVRPHRSALEGAMMAADIKADYPFGTYAHLADAILALLPGRTEAEVKAEALREAGDAVDSTGHHWSAGPALAFFNLAEGLRAHADDLDPHA